MSVFSFCFTSFESPVSLYICYRNCMKPSSLISYSIDNSFCCDRCNLDGMRNYDGCCHRVLHIHSITRGNDIVVLVYTYFSCGWISRGGGLGPTTVSRICLVCVFLAY